METTGAIKKITDLCKKAKAASVVMLCVCILAGVLCIVSAAVNLPNVRETVTDSDGTTYVATSAGALSKCISGFVLSVLYGVAMQICSKMFTGISENGTPFRSNTAESLKKISIIMLLSGILPGFFGGIFEIAFNNQAYKGMPISTMASNSGLSVSIVPLFLSLFLFVMTAVFKYGCLLQQESDETL